MTKAVEQPSLWARTLGPLRRIYAGTDPRALALFRVLLGLLLVYEVARRFPESDIFLSNQGWLANHYAIFAPMGDSVFSLYHAFSTPAEVRVLLAIHLAVNLALLVGWRTKLMQILAALLITSLNSRNIMLENGGFVVVNLLTVWSVFLPLGRRYSVDAVLRSLRSRREQSPEELNRPLERDQTPVYSLAVTALILQWVVIYYFNTVHKTGPSWMNGTALHYFLYQDRIVTDFGVWVREAAPLVVIQGMSYGTLIVEGGIAVLLLVPLFYRQARIIAWVLMIVLHGLIAAVATLGPFAWVMMCMPAVLVAPEYLDRLAAWSERRKLKVTVWLGSTPRALTFGRLLHRLDVHHKIQFEASDEDSWCVESENGREDGVPALVELGRALPVPRVLLLWLLLPGVRQLAEWALGWMTAGDAIETGPGPGHVDDRPSSEMELVGKRVGTIFAQVWIVLLLVATGSQVLVENAGVGSAYKPKRRPAWMVALVAYPRLYQGWSMFAPGPPMQDARLIVDARTVDGRKIDPLTRQPPEFTVHVSDRSRMTPNWGTFHTRIGDRKSRRHHAGVRGMLLRYHEITGNPKDRIVAFDAWWATRNISAPGTPRPEPHFRRLFFHGKVRDSGAPEGAQRPGKFSSPRR